MGPVINCRALSMRVAFVSTVRRYADYLRAESILTPKMRISYARWTSFAPILTLAFMLNLLGVRVRCRSSYLSGLNFEPWRLAHSSHALCTRLRFLQFPSVVVP